MEGFTATIRLLFVQAPIVEVLKAES